MYQSSYSLSVQLRYGPKGFCLANINRTKTTVTKMLNGKKSDTHTHTRTQDFRKLHRQSNIQLINELSKQSKRKRGEEKKAW